MSDTVAIILTTFNPDLTLLKDNISSYIIQAGKVIICDNSDDEEIALKVEELCNGKAELIYLSMNGNHGIAFAQNRGVDYAISEGFELFIEIDQDSSLPSNYVEHILSTYRCLINNNIAVAGVGPIARNKSQNFIYHNYQAGSGFNIVDKTLSSGFLYSKYAYQLVGGKDESLFIDYVDWEWCWRANKIGLNIVVDSSIEIEHMLGDGHKNILGLYVGLPSPVRLYYQYRNSLYLMRKDYISLSWKVKRVFIQILKVPFFVFFTDRRQERFKYIVKGVADFLKNKKGKLGNEAS